MSDDGLNAARGIVLGCILGIVCWFLLIWWLI